MDFLKQQLMRWRKFGAPNTLVLKKEQVSAVYEGRDVFVWLPTGFGKSICYELLPFASDHKLGRTVGTNVYSLMIVVTPLVSLGTCQREDGYIVVAPNHRTTQAAKSDCSHSAKLVEQCSWTETTVT